MEQAVLIVHALIAVVVVALILLQQGQGADAGASFGGGSSQTVFGAQGGGNMLTRWTAVLVTVFFLTSLSLAYFAKQNSKYQDGVFDDPVLLEQIDKAENTVTAEDEQEANLNEIPVE